MIWAGDVKSSFKGTIAGYRLLTSYYKTMSPLSPVSEKHALGVM